HEARPRPRGVEIERVHVHLLPAAHEQVHLQEIGTRVVTEAADPVAAIVEREPEVLTLDLDRNLGRRRRRLRRGGWWWSSSYRRSGFPGGGRRALAHKDGMAEQPPEMLGRGLVRQGVGVRVDALREEHP